MGRYSVIAYVAFGALASMLAAPVPGEAAGTAEQCKVYADNATGLYNRMRSTPNCRVADSARWNKNTSGHFNWCRTAQDAWIRSEHTARVQHVQRCVDAAKPKTSKPTKFDDSQ